MARPMAWAEVPVEETWNLEKVFGSTAEWEQALSGVSGLIPGVTAFKGRLGEGPAVLLECLKATTAVTVAFQPVAAFASLRLSEDNTSTDHQMMVGRVQAMGAQMGAATSFVASELIQLSEGTLERMSFAQGAQRIQDGLAILGPEYGELMRQALHERWIYR